MSDRYGGYEDDDPDNPCPDCLTDCGVGKHYCYWLERYTVMRSFYAMLRKTTTRATTIDIEG